MWRSMLRTATATVAYGLVHSALADDAVRRRVRVRDRVGPRAYDGLYRAAYNAQAVGTLAALAIYVRRLPDRELYRARGPLALALRAGQAAGLAYMGWSVWHVGPARFAGLDGLAVWSAGNPEVPPAAVGQGPSLGDDGAVRADGPFRHGRHPLNLAAPAVLWLNQRMTANLLAFNAVATAYFVIGSIREEARVRAAYGRAYADYQRSGVPFYLPRPGSPADPGPRLRAEAEPGDELVSRFERQ